MRYLILTDLHANLQALDAVLRDAKTVGYDRVLVLGDLVGYGADPGEVIDRTLALEPERIIRGNHDKVCAGIEPPWSFNDVARQAIEWTIATLTPDHRRVLAELPKGPTRVTDRLEICHGAPFDEDYYLFDTDDAQRAIEAATTPLCLFGHTHIPAVFVVYNDPRSEVEAFHEDILHLPAHGRALVNVGAVGQPRDGDPRAAYGVLDDERNTIQLCRVIYDVAAAQARILEAGLPAWLAMRLERGQ